MQSFMPLTGIDATSTKRTGFLGFWIRLKTSRVSKLLGDDKSGQKWMFHSQNFQT